MRLVKKVFPIALVVYLCLYLLLTVFSVGYNYNEEPERATSISSSESPVPSLTPSPDPIILIIQANDNILYRFEYYSDEVTLMNLLIKASDELQFKLVLDSLDGFSFVRAIDTYRVISQSNYLWVYSVDNMIPVKDLTEVLVKSGQIVEFTWRDG